MKPAHRAASTQAGRTPVQDAEAIVLLSGGLDSTTVLYLAREQGFRPVAISFDYSQRHVIELRSAGRVAAAAGVADHIIAHIDTGIFGGSALTDRNIAVPHEPATGDAIPITYVPARNMLFLTYAIALAESRGASDVFLGVNALDYSGYPDCRPEFIEAFTEMVRLGTRTGVEGSPIKIHAPLIHMTKAQIIREGLRLGVDYALTFSCYDPTPTGAPCGTCDSCRLRALGFAECGVAEPEARSSRTSG